MNIHLNKEGAACDQRLEVIDKNTFEPLIPTEDNYLSVVQGCKVCRYTHPAPLLVANVLIPFSRRVQGNIVPAVVLVKRVKPQLGLALPGGKVEENEHPRVAAVRECLEEVQTPVVLIAEPLLIAVDCVRNALVLIYKAEMPKGIPRAAGSNKEQVYIKPVGEIPYKQIGLHLHSKAIYDWESGLPSLNGLSGGNRNKIV